jgi:uncharacterized surface protein with fasciclin (FAS1) repeats
MRANMVTQAVTKTRALKGTLRRALTGATRRDACASPRSRAKDMTMRDEMVSTDWVQKNMATTLMSISRVAPRRDSVDCR